MRTIGESFIDVDSSQRAKAGQVVSGDVFLSRRIKPEGRIISILSDGLGSGVKASVLANLTATMALRYTSAFVDVRKSAGTIMDTLPICEVRKISYSTFTIVDLDEQGHARAIEHGNPALVLMRGQTALPLERVDITLDNWKDRTIRYSEFDVQLGDRIVCFSDGISQSGLGRKGLPLGWGSDNFVRFLSQQVGQEPEISSQELARKVVAEALVNDGAPPRTTSPAAWSITGIRAGCWSSPGRRSARSAMRSWPRWPSPSPGAKPSAAGPPRTSSRACSTGPSAPA